MKKYSFMYDRYNNGNNVTIHIDKILLGVAYFTINNVEYKRKVYKKGGFNYICFDCSKPILRVAI